MKNSSSWFINQNELLRCSSWCQIQLHHHSMLLSKRSMPRKRKRVATHQLMKVLAITKIKIIISLSLSKYILNILFIKMTFLIILRAMNSKLREVSIINDSNDFPKGIRFILNFVKNMTYKHMPFYDKCCSLHISFFSILSHEGKKNIWT